ncbi:hypothetical protein [Burkholderia sp. PAMC 26561]|uniref:hypothetical protein n=1 Tax=Burkholderia sp. PAMC 26561 TaxID=1795043 RepID=UPI00084D4892|nr:hypothetical protein [Burkholderia sp. PAMC 26561]
MKRKIRANRKMTEDDVLRIKGELKRWEMKELGTKLTWDILERFSGFTRPALSAHPEIVDALKLARLALQSDRAAATRASLSRADEIVRENARLAKELAKYKRGEDVWHEKWICIAYNAQARGISIEELTQNIPPNGRR